MPEGAGSPAQAHPSGGQGMPQSPSTAGLSVPDLRQCHYVRPAHYAVAVVDGHGRIASRSPLRALGWEPGTVVAFTVDGNRLITAARSTTPPQQGSTAPRRTITACGQLNLPVLTRRRAGITSGDRLLLAADEHAGLLWICPPKVLALILYPYTQAGQP